MAYYDSMSANEQLNQHEKITARNAAIQAFRSENMARNMPGVMGQALEELFLKGWDACYQVAWDHGRESGFVAGVQEGQSEG